MDFNTVYTDSNFTGGVIYLGCKLLCICQQRLLLNISYIFIIGVNFFTSMLEYKEASASTNNCVPSTAPTVTSGIHR